MIEVRHISKDYNGRTAVSDLSFTIEPGKIYGFLGPNGAGKSTTMNIMTGCLAPTSGQVLIRGHDIFEEPVEAKKLIGYLPELPPLYTDMTCGEYLRFVGKMKGLRGEELRAEVRQVMEATGTAGMENRLIRQLSKGYRQRVGVAQAILGRPEVIILDEPTVGLDPKQIMEIRGLIRSLGREHTVILSSHILSEVRAVCDEIIIISHGRLVAQDTPDNLERLFSGSTTLSMTVRGTRESIAAALSAVPEIGSLTFGEEALGRVAVNITGAGGEADGTLAEAVFFALADARLPILSMQRSSVSLEDVFLELTEKPDEPEAPAEEAKEAAE